MRWADSALNRPYSKKTDASGSRSTIISAARGAATKTRTRTLELTWRRISDARPRAASRDRVGNRATAMDTPMIPTGSWLSWNA